MFRSRNPLFQNSETYKSEKEKRRHKRRLGKANQFSSADFYFDNTTMSCRCPAGKEMWLQSKNIKIAGKKYARFTGYLKDCKKCPVWQQCMRKEATITGRQVQFVIDSFPFISYGDKMKTKIDSSEGRRQYSKRLGSIEPIFGNITVNKGMNKFTLRGQEKVNTQWQMYCLVHNMEKLRNTLH